MARTVGAEGTLQRPFTIGPILADGVSWSGSQSVFVATTRNSYEVPSVPALKSIVPVVLAAPLTEVCVTHVTPPSVEVSSL